MHARAPKRLGVLVCLIAATNSQPAGVAVAESPRL